LLAPILLLFVASLQSGNVRSWLGQKSLDALRHSGRADLAATLTDDFDQAAKQAAAPQAEGWHSLPVPFVAEGELGRLQLHLRRYPESGEREADSGDRGEPGHKGIRFLIDVEPSALGPIQLDGLVRQRATPTGARVLDLILRSRTLLPADIRQDLSRLFTLSLATSGLNGALAFQGGSNWVKVVPERPHAAMMFA
jgi:hypothetical protein